MKKRYIVAGALILSSVLKIPTNQPRQNPAIAAQNGAPSPYKPPTKEAAFEFLNPRTVHIMANGIGTGSVLPGNRILTCNHVVRGADTAQVRMGDQKTVLPAKVIKRNEDRDLALLKVEHATELPSIALAPRAALPGEKIFVLGSPKGVQGTLVDGAVKEAIAQGDLEVKAPILPGNSGGALALPLGDTFVQAGVVCGVPKGGPKPSITAFSISLDAVKDLAGGGQ